MTFEEARELMGAGRLGEVVLQMRKWHPAELGIMLLAVQAAREERYNAPHPDYYNALAFCLSREREPSQKIARFDRNLLRRHISRARAFIRKQTGR